MLSVKIDNIKALISASKSLKEIAKSEIGDGEIKLLAQEKGLYLQSSESGVYFLSKYIEDTTVITPGSCFINAKDLSELIDCINHAGLSTVKITVEDKTLIVDGSILGEIKIPLPVNQQAWKRSPLSREDIEWELLTSQDNSLLFSLNRFKDFHAKNYIKLSLTKESCFMDISAVNETGTTYASCRNKLNNTSSFNYSFIINNKLVNNFLKMTNQEDIKVYINKDGEGEVDLERENIMYKLESPECKFIFYSNYNTPASINSYENYFLKQEPICQIKLKAENLINAVNWQLFKLNPSGSIYISFDQKQSALCLSEKSDLIDLSEVPLTQIEGSWDNNYYSVVNISKLIPMINRKDDITIKLIKQEVGDDFIYVLFISVDNSGDNFMVGMNFSEEI